MTKINSWKELFCLIFFCINNVFICLHARMVHQRPKHLNISQVRLVQKKLKKLVLNIFWGMCCCCCCHCCYWSALNKFPSNISVLIMVFFPYFSNLSKVTFFFCGKTISLHQLSINCKKSKDWIVEPKIQNISKNIQYQLFLLFFLWTLWKRF